jgi:hypothetical protein
MATIQLKCKVDRAAGGCEFSCVQLTPAEMLALDGKKFTIDGEVIRFKMWNGSRLYVNQRRWTLGFFSLVEFDIPSAGYPHMALLQGNMPSPKVAQAVAQLLNIEDYRMVEIQ